MPDVENVITQGIGSAPGNIRYFVLVGLDVNPSAAAPVGLTLRRRGVGLTLETRSAGLTLKRRSVALTVEDDPR